MPLRPRKCQDEAVARFDSSSIRRFYDRNTPAFARFGQGGRSGAIRRAVWGPGVTNRDQAFHFVDHQIAEQVSELSADAGTLHVLDLGCGLGASLCYLASRHPIRATGVTISAVQARHATARFREAGLGDRVTCLEADYCHLPASLAPADLAYAI
jgi:SAM-dependent methyltransferase